MAAPDLFEDGPTRTQVGDANWRFSLTEIWDATLPMLGFLGTNPSDASDDRSDPTWARLGGFGRRWGFGGVVGVNGVPFRTPDTATMLRLLDDTLKGRTPTNLEARALVRNFAFAEVVGSMTPWWLVGWGDAGEKINQVCDSPRLERMCQLIDQGAGGRAQFFTFGLTKGGAPIHPLARGKMRVPDDAPVYRFDPCARILGDAMPAWPPGAPS